MLRPFFGETAPTKPNQVESSAETLDHNAAVISSSIPLDEMGQNFV